jgi:hypothetical protein
MVRSYIISSRRSCMLKELKIVSTLRAMGLFNLSVYLLDSTNGQYCLENVSPGWTRLKRNSVDIVPTMISDLDVFICSSGIQNSLIDIDFIIRADVSVTLRSFFFFENLARPFFRISRGFGAIVMGSIIIKLF